MNELPYYFRTISETDNITLEFCFIDNTNSYDETTVHIKRTYKSGESICGLHNPFRILTLSTIVSTTTEEEEILDVDKKILSIKELMGIDPPRRTPMRTPVPIITPKPPTFISTIIATNTTIFYTHIMTADDFEPVKCSYVVLPNEETVDPHPIKLHISVFSCPFIYSK
ncbi:hypothetical protein TVAG_145160 [Trichomonas vaginalis G3]|uniref:Uncharacterized protein n=1 Tax=Trichomonas vaginalis (strain ATCC PRA-98 / G3) TaxID=412133 RepID=A2EUJ8_TRIV3|nr:hypothetical protein TVAGG3_0547950 [Trichomonas vaginalis G3]EAY03647.1 hypothetical protein TVAG_145160 [Trichomonas vaginalis G3]KAI5520301.1 hypothetical protein TVAGG3_0547950 [Trichomonas vaginalis G3]|eukprot:XP_001315870.1 hypothetical protein [Trichomonas vaginalis G3]